MEPFYPLHVYVCEHCFLVQLEEYVSPDEHLHRVRLLLVLFGLAGCAHAQHLRRHDRSSAGPRRPSITSSSSGSNDGYLLQYFVEKGIPVLGIEPARNVAAAGGRERGPDREPSSSAARRRASSWREGRTADLIVGNNVLAQVPDVNDFVGGIEHPAQARAASSPSSFRISMRLMDGEPVRHDLPRALLLLLLLDRRTDLRRARPDALRRRGAADARRVAPDLRAPRRATRREPVTERAHGAARARGDRRASTGSSATPRSPSRCTRRSGGCSSS